jgi:hypothetical protein
VTVTASQAGNGTYAAATPVMRSIVVNPASLSVGVTGIPTRIYGQANPAFTATISGFVNGDTPASAVTGSPVLSTTAVPKSNAGSYPITVGLGTLAATNYNFTPVNGQLTVTGGAPQAITFSGLANFTHGTVVPLIAVATSGLPVTFTVTGGPATVVNGNTLSITGTGAVSVTASQAGTGNFAPATSVTRTFTAQ